MPNNQALQVFYGNIPLIIVLFAGSWINNRRIDDMRETLKARITDLKTSIKLRLSAIENRLTAMETRLS